MYGGGWGIFRDREPRGAIFASKLNFPHHSTPTLLLLHSCCGTKLIGIIAIMDKRRIYDQIRNLLKRRHEPLVEVGKSIITGAGNGVFSRQCIGIDQTDETTASTPSPTVMCLYPGIYTPDIPPSSCYHDETTTTHYLANQIPPSFQHGNGPDMSSNAYILNLQRCGGYIDGWSIKSQYCSDSNNREESRRLDINPSACGHLINHHAYDCNTSVFSFSWREVLEQQPQEEECNDGDDSDENDYFSLPNEMRLDGKTSFAMVLVTVYYI